MHQQVNRRIIEWALKKTLKRVHNRFVVEQLKGNV